VYAVPGGEFGPMTVAFKKFATAGRAVLNEIRFDEPICVRKREK
jgi:hypothetical protein